MKIRRWLMICVMIMVAINLGGSAWAKEPKKIKLKYTQPLAKAHACYGAIWRPIFDKIQEKTGNRFKATEYFTATLASPRDHYSLVVEGIADASAFPLVYNPGRFPITELVELPIQFSGGLMGWTIYKTLWEKGYLSKELGEVKVIAVGTTSEMELVTTTPIRSLKDLKGKKIRFAGSYMGDSIARWGGVPVAMVGAELYSALQSGLLDGTMTDVTTIAAYKLYEVAPYLTNIKMFGGGVAIVMNKKYYEKLPADVKKAINEVGDEFWTLPGLRLEEDEDQVQSKLIKEGKLKEVIDLSVADMEKMVELGRPVIGDWVKRTKAKGYPQAQESLDAYLIEQKKWLKAYGLKSLK